MIRAGGGVGLLGSGPMSSSPLAGRHNPPTVQDTNENSARTAQRLFTAVYLDVCVGDGERLIVASPAVRSSVSQRFLPAELSSVSCCAAIASRWRQCFLKSPQTSGLSTEFPASCPATCWHDCNAASGWEQLGLRTAFPRGSGGCSRRPGRRRSRDRTATCILVHHDLGRLGCSGATGAGAGADAVSGGVSPCAECGSRSGRHR